MVLHITYIVVRFIVGFVSLSLICIALFTFEDEDGALTSRIEYMWIAVDDRKKITHSWPTALFNLIAQRSALILSGLFGHDLFTGRALATSVNISVAYTFLANGYHDLLLGRVLSKVSPEMSIAIAGSTSEQHIRSSVYEVCLSIAISLIICLRYKYKNAAARMLNYLPSLIVLGWSAFEWLTDNPVGDVEYFRALPFLFSLSAISDIAAISSIRSAFVRIANNKRLGQIGITAGSLVILATTVVFGPIALGHATARFLGKSGNPTYQAIRFVLECSEEVSKLNVTTALIGALPLFVVIIALAEKMLWPLSSRAIYPLLKFDVIGRTKLLLSVGALGLAYATGIGEFIVKDCISLVIR